VLVLKKFSNSFSEETLLVKVSEDIVSPILY